MYVVVVAISHTSGSWCMGKLSFRDQMRDRQITDRQTNRQMADAMTIFKALTLTMCEPNKRPLAVVAWVPSTRELVWHASMSSHTRPDGPHELDSLFAVQDIAQCPGCPPHGPLPLQTVHTHIHLESNTFEVRWDFYWCCWLGVRKGIRPVKNWVVGCWHGCLHGVQTCI